VHAESEHVCQEVCDRVNLNRGAISEDLHLGISTGEVNGDRGRGERVGGLSVAWGGR
jgi:hypothetical protein